MSEHHVAIVSFAGAVKREVKRVRKELAKDESMSSFNFSIEASGRVHDGEVKLKYSVADNDYGSGAVTGDDLDACLEELLRRRGWKARHDPKALSYEAIPDGDNLPF